MAALIEAKNLVLLLSPHFRHMGAFIWKIDLMRDGAIIHDTHVVNTVSTYLPEVADP